MGEERPTPFIGVLTTNVPRELRAHFGLQEGFGLLVQEVMPDTPAEAAGLRTDDILVKFEDQKLVNMDQLQTLVRSKKKGDQVAFTVISSGQDLVVSVRLDERMMPVNSPEGRRGDGYFQPFNGGDREGPGLMNEMRESLGEYQRKMREYQDRVRDWSRDENRGQMPPPPAWDGPGRLPVEPQLDPALPGDRERGGKPSREDTSTPKRDTANVTRSDDSGFYSLRQEAERSIFTARPNGQPEQSWDVGKEEERRSIPAALQEKLRLLEEIRGAGKMPDTSSPNQAAKPGGGTI